MSLRAYRMTRRSAWLSSTSTDAPFCPFSSFYVSVFRFNCPSIYLSFYYCELPAICPMLRPSHPVACTLFGPACCAVPARLHPFSHASFYSHVLLLLRPSSPVSCPYPVSCTLSCPACCPLSARVRPSSHLSLQSRVLPVLSLLV